MKINRLIAVLFFCTIGLFGTDSACAQKAYSNGIEKVRASVAQITVILWPPYDVRRIPDEYKFLGSGDPWIAGTAFLVNDDADFVTAAHVALAVRKMLSDLAQVGIHAELMVGFVGSNVDSSAVTIRGDVVGISARIIAIDPEHDVAVIQSGDNPEGVTSSVLGKTNSLVHKPVRFSLRKPRDGDEVFACGFPMGSRDLISTKGHIASSEGFEPLITAKNNGFNAPSDVYKIDLRVSPGNSGGPLVQVSDQAIIGIVIEVMPSGGFATAVPATEITTFLTKNQIRWDAVKGK